MECGKYNEMVNVAICICEMLFLFFFVFFYIFLSFVGAKVNPFLAIQISR